MGFEDGASGQQLGLDEVMRIDGISTPGALYHKTHEEALPAPREGHY
jgi:hypothetical protein